MSLRKRLGPVYESYPAKNIAEYLGNRLFKLFATFVIWGIWTIAYRIFANVINFNMQSFVEGTPERSNADFFRTPWILGGLFLGYLIIAFLVHRSKIGEKQARNKRK